MDKCLNNLETRSTLLDKRQTEQKICDILGKEYKRTYKKDICGFNFYTYAPTNKYICFLSHKFLMETKDIKFDYYVQKYTNHNTLRSKFITINDARVMIVYDKNPPGEFKSQAGFFSNILDMLTGPLRLLTDVRDTIKTVTSKASKLFIIDVISLILQIKDGYLTATKVVSVLMNLYTLHLRYVEIFQANGIRSPTWDGQSGPPNLTDLLVGFAALGLPRGILDAIKTFTTITGKRIFDSDLIMDTARGIFDSLIVIIEWISEPITGFKILKDDNRKMIIDFIRYLGSSAYLHTDIKQVCSIYSKYVSNSQALFDPVFRQEIMNLHSRLIKDVHFMDYINNSDNRYFKTTWSLFEANVVKSCKAFDTSGRDEPLCFVFEGDAGSGKSQLMNMFVDLLRESGMTTICHSVPAAEDGKDFYDDYENQDVFVIDDMGQQGRSQWRYLINYVSPVKYPLPCASASKKNTKFFNSKIVLITTNHFTDLSGFTSSDCISEPEALFRRAHVFRVDRNDTDSFSQRITYKKFDHKVSKTWKNEFIHHNAVNVPDGLETTLDTTVFSPRTRSYYALNWLYQILNHIRDSNAQNIAQLIVPTEDLRRIIQDNATQENAQFYDALDFDSQMFSLPAFLRFACRSFEFQTNNVFCGLTLCKEFLAHYTKRILDYAKECIGFITSSVAQLFSEESCKRFIDNSGIFYCGVIGLAIVGFFAYEVNWSKLYHGTDTDPLFGPGFNQQNVKENFVRRPCQSKRIFGPQMLIERLEQEEAQWISDVRRGCKTLIVHGTGYEGDVNTQCVVSGKRVLLPAHIDIGDRFVDFYSSWDHYRNKHVELEGVKMKLLKRYLLSDLAVYEIIDTVPLYKLNKQIFRNGTTDSTNWHLINSTGSIPVVFDKDVMQNDEQVSYCSVAQKYNHDIGSGYFTPYTAAGGCGTILAAPGIGIIGFHVAGDATTGFCVQPPKGVREEIVDLMLNAPSATNFTLDQRIIPGFSGVRVRYETPIENEYLTTDTSYTESVLHVDVCPDMKDLISELETSPTTYTTVPVDKLDKKAPPNFKSAGTGKKTLKALSMKTFKHQGRITQDELDFMSEYLRSIMIEFSDLTDYETAFGGNGVQPLNKDSSNGYACLKGKDKYFDFDNKIIKTELYELVARIKDAAINERYDYNDFMCKESFKDELRASKKVDNPRTFRVMPLGHIWWTKKIFGRLLKHFKDTRHETGISIGYNPYTDADILAKKLLPCITTGDGDWKEWDGRTVAAIMRLVFDTMKEFYRGEHSYLIDWLKNTIATSFVKVNDEIWATTHGLPSGTWLTLLLNCLINKCLTALIIFRHKPEPTVQDVHNVVDYVTGDDKIMGAHEDMAEYFNLLTLKATSDSLGMECTNGDKTPITQKSQSFDKLTYVKRHFRRHPILKRYVGCLSLDTIMNTLQWINSDTIDCHEAMLGKMRSMQVESYLHSPALFRRLTDIFSERFPFDAFFDEKKVLRILNSPDGYAEMLHLQEKFFMFDVTQDEIRRYITQLENNDTQFKQISNSDFTVDSQNMSTTVAAVTTRQIQSIDSPFNDNFMRVSIPDAYRVDAKAFIERPFYVDEVTFPSTAQRYSLLNNTVRFLPGDIARSNPSVLNMFKMASYGRPDLVLNASMAGTITHAGCVLMGVLPPMPAFPTANKSLINTILTGPHAFLHANEATSIVIPAPWYCNADLATTDMEQTQGYLTTLDITETNGNYATLVFMVLNPLTPSTGSTNSLKIVVEACFKNFDLAVPTPRFVTWLPQSGRKKNRASTSPELMSFVNINYDEVDRIAREHSLEIWGTMNARSKRTFIARLRSIAPYVSIGTTLVGLILRLAFSLLAEGEDESSFKPQSGIVNAITGGLSGLLDSTAAGIKKVTGDAIDAGRGLIREYTGLHNPNVPEIHQRVISTETNFVNYADAPQFFEKLDPFTKFNRIVKEPIFGSTLDEMAITNVVTKKQFLGTFVVSINDAIGQMKWARPISPFQGGDGLEQAGSAIKCYNNLELLHSFSRGWRGGLKLTIQSVMNNKQQCKLRVIKLYNPSVNITTAYPSYKSIVNAPTHLLEFTQGGQEHEIRLPYLCRNDITPCASNTSFEAMFHGMYYIYVAQPLVISDSSPNQIEFNIYLSGEDDLTFYGYSTSITYHSNYGILPTPTNNRVQSLVPSQTFDDVRKINIPKGTYYIDSDNQELFIKRNVSEYLQHSSSTRSKEEINNITIEVSKLISKLVNLDQPTPSTTLGQPPPMTESRRLAIDIREKFNRCNALYLRCLSVLGADKYRELLGKAKVEDSSVLQFDTSHLHTWEAVSLRQIFTPRRFEPQSGNSIKVMNEPQDQSHVTRDDSKEQQLTHMTRLMPSVDIRHFIRRMYKSSVNYINIDPLGASNSTMPLASILGELPNNWNYTPIETFSRMYYGKTAGFKFRISITVDRISAEAVSDIDQLDFRVYYIPQNMNALTGPKLIASALPNLSAIPSPITNASDCIPLPYSVIAKHTTRTSKVFEFTLPDTSFYKFMGSPIKFYNFDGNANPRIPAQADFGSLIFQYTNLNEQFKFSGVIEIFVGLTDESRFGYHTMAPPFAVYKTASLYLGTDASSTASIPPVVNPFLYRGGFL